MTRRAVASELSPFALAAGQGIYLEDIQEVIEQLAYSQARGVEVLLALATGSTGWGSVGTEARTHDQTISGSSSTRYEFRIWVDPDVLTLRCAARADVPAGTTCTVTFTLGSSSTTLTFVGATTPTTVQTGDVAVSASGSGLLTCSISVARTAGSGTGELLGVAIYAVPLADGDLVAPPDE